MPKTWKELLADKAIPDNTEVPIGNEKLTIGQLRSLDAEKDGQVAKALQEATEKKGQLDTQLVQAATVYAQLQDELKKAQTNPSTDTKNKTAEPDYSTDPVLGPLAAKIAKLEEGTVTLQKTLKDSLEGLGKEMRTAVGSYISDEWGRSFKAMPELRDPVLKDIYSKVTLQEALKYADSNKVVDHRGVPDPVEATHRMLRAQREEAIRKFERGEGRKEGTDTGRRQVLESMPKPGVAGPRAVIQPKYKNMEEAMAHVAEDPEVAEQLNKLAGVRVQ